QAEEVVEATARKTVVADSEKERQARAQELLRMAASLDDVLRNLLEPELERLRELEAQGAALEEQMGEQAGAAEDELVEFASGLEQGEMKSAAQQIREALSNSNTSPSPSILRQPLAVGEALKFANQQIRERIRELILRELEADRDSPVPPQYRTAVDDYFRRVAAPIE
ncbi:MAG: hypothetical protein MI861_21180, partial [Pirellulales bacterium]|nr:hypothetical protein [Pirellulales bacterium]